MQVEAKVQIVTTLSVNETEHEELMRVLHDSETPFAAEAIRKLRELGDEAYQLREKCRNAGVYAS
jgi:hypothetical protein